MAKLLALSGLVLLTLGAILAYQQLTKTKANAGQELIAAATTQVPAVLPDWNKGELSAWLWQTPLTLDEIKLGQLLDFAAEENIDRLYVRIDDYIDAFELPDKTERQKQLEAYEAATLKLLTQARARKIEVEALIGNPNWGNLELNYIPLEILNFVSQYNQKHPEAPFAGIHFDIEVYQLPDYERNQVVNLYDYLVMVDQMTQAIAAKNLGENFRVGWAIPYWYVTGEGKAPPLVWKGNKATVAEHLVKMLGDMPSAYLALMAYRDDPMEAVNLSRIVLETINQLNPQLEVVVGQETAQTEEKGVSHFGKSREEIKTILDQIEAGLVSQANFQGLTIHSLESYREIQ